jgi:hypothetical protein
MEHLSNLTPLELSLVLISAFLVGVSKAGIKGMTFLAALVMLFT